MKRIAAFVVGVSLIGAPVFAGDEVVPFERFPTGRDRSIQLMNANSCRWWDGRTATQGERAMIYLEGVSVLQAQGLLYAKYSKACESTGRSKEGEFQSENLRLRYFYVDMKRDREWSLPHGDCPDYRQVQNLGLALRTCSTRTEAARVECAASPYMTQDILDWTDMRIEDGQCVAGAIHEEVIPSEGEDQEMAMRGHLDYRIPLPPLTPEQRSLARNVMELHHAGSDNKCGEHTEPMNQTVKEGMKALLQSAISEKQKHAFLMIFPTVTDRGPTGWNAQEACDWARIEHFAWVAWDSCLDLPGEDMWGCLTRARVSHETAHIIAAYRSERRLDYRISDHVTYPMNFPGRTPDEWLECFRNDPDHCGITWLPADWRIILPQESE